MAKIPKWNQEAPPAQNAREKLPEMAAAYFDQGRKLLQENVPEEELHDFRLATKRFRYTLELFRPLYGPSLDARLASLRHVQTHLGELNDCATTRALVGVKLAGRVRKPFLAFLEKAAQQHAAAFREYWRTTFDAPGQEQKWQEYLTRFAGRKRTPK